MEERMDKSVFMLQSFDDADHTRHFWLSKAPEERLQAAYLLALRAYGYDPNDPPSMDKQFFQIRARTND